jgi:uncharacterized protein (TIGR03437 family)
MPQGADVFAAVLAQTPPAGPSIAAVLNSASQAGALIAPGESITIVGANPNTTVLLDGAPLTVLDASPDRIVARVPTSYAPSSAARLQLADAAGMSGVLLMPAGAAAPAIYTQDGTGLGLGLIFNPDGTLNGADHPAIARSLVTIACNGIAPGAEVSVSIGGSIADVTASGTASLPGIAGDATMLTVRVPVLTLHQAAVLVKAGGVVSRVGVGIQTQ